ncbi:MAG TPA: hypothetical protein DEO82_05025 [Eubacterium sp.]|nr:hypothetical protein [Eubacterium sp.]
MNKETRKLLRRKTNMELRKHYLMKVMVVFIVSFMVGGFSYATMGSGNSRFLSMGYSVFNSIEDIIKEQTTLDTMASDDTSQYTKGVLSVFVNQISKTNSIIVGIINALNILIFRGRMVNALVVLFAIVIAILLGVFFNNIILVGQSRFFLEQRNFDKTSFKGIWIVFRYGFTANVALVMFLKTLYQMLWNLTVIGGIIKYYEYSMIPYILAENPAVKPKEAFALSRRLTHGHKKEIFLMDLSLIVWYAVVPFTYNIVSVFYLKPYIACMYAEIYAYLRTNAPAYCVDYLTDHELFKPYVSNGAYQDSYFPYKLKHHFNFNVDYRRDYSLVTYILLFFSFACFGWLWEVLYTMIYMGLIVNRGTMAGPWVPIYGVGGLLILISMKPLREKPVKVFIGSMAVAGVVEYMAGFILEKLFHERWWNYTGFYLNINGRVCLEGLLAFGLIGVAFVYIIAPVLDSLYGRISEKKKIVVCVILVTGFMIDLVYSFVHPNIGEGITTMIWNGFI